MDNKYTAYLFDFDYTLALTERGIILCFRHVLDLHGFAQPTDDEIKRTIGYTVTDGFTMLAGVTDPDVLEQMRQEYAAKGAEAMTANTELYPDTIPTLKRLKEAGVKVAIVSTKQAYRINEALDAFGCHDLIDVVIGLGDVSNAKPDPEGIHKALAALGVDKAHALYCGDSFIDAQAARNAGVDFAAVTTGTTTRETFAKYPCVKVMERLGEII